MSPRNRVTGVPRFDISSANATLSANRSSHNTVYSDPGRACATRLSVRPSREGKRNDDGRSGAVNAICRKSRRVAIVALQDRG